MTPRKSRKNWIESRRIAPVLMIVLSLSLCFGCSPKIQTVALIPPESLLIPIPSPEMPEALTQSRDLRAYGLAATRYIWALHENIALRDAQNSGLRAWYKAVDKELHRE